MYAEHVIGMRALEHARQDNQETAESVHERFLQIQASGVLRPRLEPKALGEDGSLFALDRLAGDHRYVFLSYGSRYRDLRSAHLCYGFLFDAQPLIEQLGALVGPDMVDVYDDILDRVVCRIDAALPPLPMVSDEEIAEFGRLLGENDPALLAYVQQASTSRYHDIETAVRRGDMSVEGAQEATIRFQKMAYRCRRRLRKSGAEALAALAASEASLEVLVPGELPLSFAIGTIEAGVLQLK